MNLGAFRRRLDETEVNADKHWFFQCEGRLGRVETEGSSINPLFHTLPAPKKFLYAEACPENISI
jgi:hypothetical protein